MVLQNRHGPTWEVWMTGFTKEHLCYGKEPQGLLGGLGTHSD